MKAISVVPNVPDEELTAFPDAPGDRAPTASTGSAVTKEPNSWAFPRSEPSGTSGPTGGSGGADARDGTVEIRQTTAIGGQLTGHRRLLVGVAMLRTRRFGMFSILILVGSVFWAGMRYYLMVDGENQVIKSAFDKLASSIRNTVQQRVTQDLIYQEMVANVWTIYPNISRAEFRKLVNSELYAPGLTSMTGMSLIPRVLGADHRATLENHPDSETLRQECCANGASVGSSCATVAATGLFCNTSGEMRYQFTQFADGGVLVPAVGDSQAYIDRVGEEEYMIVDMIEPFSSNAKVWGFNLLSSDARLAAWRTSTTTGQKTFTRRLNLVQSSSAEYGFLVWLPIFEKSDGEWVTALDGNTAGLTPVASVNGVYRAQNLLTEAIESTYSKEQLADVRIFLFDNADELNGDAEFLGAYGAGDNSYTEFGDATISSISSKSESGLFKEMSLVIPTADAKWILICEGSQQYRSERRSPNSLIALVFTCLLLVSSTIDRWLGHPTLIVECVNKYKELHDMAAAGGP